MPPALPSRTEPKRFLRRPRTFFTPDVIKAALAGAASVALALYFDRAEPNSVPWSVVLTVALLFGLVARVLHVTDDQPPFEVGRGEVRISRSTGLRQLSCADLIAVRMAGQDQAGILTLETTEQALSIPARELVDPTGLHELQAAILREVQALPDGEIRIANFASLSQQDAFYAARRSRATYLLCGVIGGGPNRSMSKRGRATRPTMMPTVRSPPVPADGGESCAVEGFDKLVCLGTNRTGLLRSCRSRDGHASLRRGWHARDVVRFDRSLQAAHTRASERYHVSDKG